MPLKNASILQSNQSYIPPYIAFLDGLDSQYQWALMFGLVMNLFIALFVQLNLLGWTYSSGGVSHKPLRRLILVVESEKGLALTYLTSNMIIRLSGFNLKRFHLDKVLICLIIKVYIFIYAVRH